MGDSSETNLARALRVLLRPLVRLVLRRGMAFGELAEIVKRVYVDVARRELAVPGKRPTISRIAVLTGLTRKEASRLVAEADGDDAVREDRRRINRAARVLTGWVQDAAFLDGRGLPATLPFDADDGPSVSTLVRRHGADVPPRAVLDELMRVGAVHETRDGRYRPVERAYVPRGGDDEKLAILGTDVADLIAAIDHNISDTAAEPFFQRKVAYDALPVEFLPELRDLVRTEAQRLLEQLDAEMAQHDRDTTPGEGPGGHRAMIGIYYYEEENDDSESSS
jgi:hypothetical protein